MTYRWVMTVFRRSDEAYMGDIELTGLDSAELRELLGAADDDPMFDVYPIDYPIGSPRRYSWIRRKTDANLDPEAFEYFLEQRLDEVPGTAD